MLKVSRKWSAGGKGPGVKQMINTDSQVVILIFTEVGGLKFRCNGFDYKREFCQLMIFFMLHNLRIKYLPEPDWI